MARFDTLPEHSALITRRAQCDFCDAVSFVLPDAEPAWQPDQVYAEVFARLPGFVERMMLLRNALVKPLGFRVQPVGLAVSLAELRAGQGSGLHQIDILTENEIVCTSEELHMQVSLSVYRRTPREFTLSTMVTTHSRLGYWYLQAIIPWHKVIAMASVRQMVRRMEMEVATQR